VRREARHAPSAKPTAPPTETFRFATGTTSVGSVLVAMGHHALAAVIIQEGNDTRSLVATLRSRFPRAGLRPHQTMPALRAVISFIERPRTTLALPLDIRGTPFQRRVWNEVLKIPFGNTTTFAAIARRIGSPTAVRAVGNACSRNPLEFAIPCHRVLRSDGSPSGGSAWGNHRQSTLLMREANARSRARSRCASL
jgi:AraC family transcriptional regulator, regulatory protein of adaptative response / methylated-DNA-[protein]-cysteine methyltransferase